MSGGIGTAFPQNPARPSPLGRGARESIVTPGLQAIHQQLDKNRTKASKNMETRLKNRMPVQMPTPSPSITVPPTPMSKTPANASHPLPLRGPMIATNGSVVPRSPFTPIYSQSLSPASSPSMRPTPAIVLAQNYQPTYPDFSHLSTPQRMSPAPAAAPQDDSTTRFEIARFVAHLSPEERAHFMAGINVAGSGEYDNGISGADGTFGSSNDYDLNLVSDNHNGFNRLIDQAGDMPEFDEIERPWNVIAPAEGEGQDDDQEDVQPQENTDKTQPQDHASAQSSLEVTMQDVNVTKKRSRRRTRAQILSDDDDDASKKKSRKKAKNRKQRSRSIRDVDIERQDIVKEAYAHIQKSVAVSKPWPTGSESGDPDAYDDEIEELVDKAWQEAIESLGLDPEECEARTKDERNLIVSRISQVRGDIMTVADAAVPSYYRLVDPQSLADPTPEALKSAVESNRSLVDELQATYMFKSPEAPGSLEDICRHPVFQYVVNKAFFAKSGRNRRAHIFHGLDIFPIETLALVMDAIMCALDRWKTGEHDIKPATFSTATYGPVHVKTLVFLAAWQREYQLPQHPVDLASACLRDLLKNGRQAAGVSVETVPVQTSRFPMHLFTSVHAEAAPPASAATATAPPQGAPTTADSITNRGDAQ